jgi:hypothetical protein
MVLRMKKANGIIERLFVDVDQPGQVLAELDKRILPHACARLAPTCRPPRGARRRRGPVEEKRSRG